MHACMHAWMHAWGNLRADLVRAECGKEERVGTRVEDHGANSFRGLEKIYAGSLVQKHATSESFCQRLQGLCHACIDGKVKGSELITLATA